MIILNKFTFLLLITLNVNGLNSPKDTEGLSGLKTNKQTRSNYILAARNYFRFMDQGEMKGWENYNIQIVTKRKWGCLHLYHTK